MEIVRSEILSRLPSVLFGMSTASGGISEGTFGLNLSFNVDDNPENVRENRKRFFEALGISESHAAFTRQHHTSNIISVKQPGVNEHCDGLITNQKKIFLVISIADCTPVILFDTKNHVVAGIHAGWRGTAANIVGKSIDRMCSEFGTIPINIAAFIGPSAGKCCYEVGNEVARQFPHECISEKGNGKYLLDIKQSNVMELLENGVLNSNIEVHPDCTIHNRIYHSFRRDGKKSGRMFAVIGIKE